MYQNLTLKFFLNRLWLTDKKKINLKKINYFLFKILRLRKFYHTPYSAQLTGNICSLQKEKSACIKKKKKCLKFYVLVKFYGTPYSAQLTEDNCPL